MNIKDFLQFYKAPLIISILSHFLLLGLLSIGFIEHKSLNSKEVNIINASTQAIQAVAIDEAKITSIIKDIKKKEKSKVRAQKLAKNSLVSAIKSKAAAERKLKSLQDKQKFIKKESKKIAARQSRELKEFEQQKKLAQKKIQDLNQEAEKIHKANLEKKKLAEEKARIIQEQNARIIQEQNARIIQQYTSKIRSNIYKNFAVTSEQIKKLMCKIKITLNPLGQVVSVQLVKSSGDQYFDRAAMLAVKKSSPLPVPDDQKIFQEMSELMLNFTPQEFLG